MEDKKRTQATSIFFLVIALVFSFLLWMSLDKIIKTSETESWLQPVIFFSLFFISWFMGVVLSKDNGWLRILSLVVLFPSLYFVFRWEHLLVIILATASCWLATFYTKGEMDSRISIGIWHALRVGRRFFIVAVALVVASHYFFNHPQSEEGGLVPKVKLGQQQAWLATKIVSVIDPDLKAEEMEDMTIDEFILRKVSVDLKEQDLQIDEQKKNEGEISNGLWDGLTGGVNIEELEKEIALQESRKEIGGMVGKEVEGDEKMIDIVSDLINSRINEMFAPEISYSGKTGPAMMWILTIVLFLTMAFSGLFLSVLLISIAWVLFKVLIGLKLVTTEKEEAMKEVII